MVSHEHESHLDFRKKGHIRAPEVLSAVSAGTLAGVYGVFHEPLAATAATFLVVVELYGRLHSDCSRNPNVKS